MSNTDFSSISSQDLLARHQESLQRYHVLPGDPAVKAQLSQLDDELLRRTFKVVVRDKDENQQEVSRFRSEEECRKYIAKIGLMEDISIDQGQGQGPLTASIIRVNFAHNEVRAECDISTVKLLAAHNSKRVYVDDMPGVLSANFWTPTNHDEGGYVTVDFRMPLAHEIASLEILKVVQGLTFVPTA